MKLSTIITTLILIFCIFIIIFIRVGELKGQSMYPTIHDGERLILVRAIMPSNLTGWIVTYEYDTILVLHRVLGDNGTHILTKGDNNPKPEGWISKEKIMYLLVWHGKLW